MPKPRKSNLHANRKGVRPPKPYKSWFEYDVGVELVKLKTRARYEPIKLPYTLNLNYTPDWVLPNGVIIEAKGLFDSQTRRKMLAVKEANPKKRICILFMKGDNKISKASKTTYLEWAIKNGFETATGKVPPEEWLR